MKRLGLGFIVLGLTFLISYAAYGQTEVVRGEYIETFENYSYKNKTNYVEWDVANQQLRLAYTDGSGQIFPTIAPDTADGFYMAWSDIQVTYQAIYLQRFDGAGNPLWPQPRQLSQGDQAHHSTPTIAVHGENEVFVTWVYSGTTSNQIYAQTVDGTGQLRWATPITVSQASPAVNALRPTIAVTSQQVVIAWQECDVDRICDIYAQRLTSDTGHSIWDSPQRVNQLLSAERQAPVVQFDSQGNTVVGWFQRDDQETLNGNLVGQRLDSAGTRLWSFDTRLHWGNNPVYRPQFDLQLNRADQIVVVWPDEVNGSTMIYAQQVDLEGAIQWESNRLVYADPNQQAAYGPALTLTSQDEILVAWLQATSSDTETAQVLAQKLDQSGTPLWAEVIQVSQQSLVWADLQIINQNDQPILVWKDGRNAWFDIYGQRLSLEGQKQWAAADVRLAPDNGQVNQNNALGRHNLAVSAQGDITVVWSDSRHNNEDIFIRRVDSRGNRLWRRGLRVNDPDGSLVYNPQDQQYDPALAINGTGLAVVAWVDGFGDTARVYAQGVYTSGSWTWLADLPLDETSSEAQLGPDVALTEEGEALVVWFAGSADRSDIYAQRLDTQGQPRWSSPLKINPDSLTTAQRWPIVGLDEADNATIVWQSQQANQGNLADIYLRRIDPAGNFLGSARPINRTTSNKIAEPNQLTPHVTFSADTQPDGQTVVVWEDMAHNIYLQQITASDALLLDTEQRVITAGNQPAVVYDKAEVLLAWHGLDEVIYTQRLANNLTPRWRTVIDESGKTNAPAIAIAPTGETVVTWERGSYVDLWLYQLDQGGSPTWDNPVKLVEPDIFYFQQGQAESHPLTSTHRLIKQATLTADFERNSAQVRFYLTNNGGQQWAEVTPGITHIFTTTGSDLRWRADFLADQIWNRTPIIHNLRVNYYAYHSGRIASWTAQADLYELTDNGDQTCQQAHPIQVGGQAQDHTFHTDLDLDWVKFEAEPNQTYIVSATTDPNAQIDLQLLYQAECPGPSGLPIDEDVVGRNADITFTTADTIPADQFYYIQASHFKRNQPLGSQQYHLSVRKVAQKPPLVVIIPGRNNRGLLESQIKNTAQKIKQDLIDADVPAFNIKADLTPYANKRATDVGSPYWYDIREAIQAWPIKQEIDALTPLYLFFVGHGHATGQGFCATSCDTTVVGEGADIMTPYALDRWLDDLEKTEGLELVNVLLEASYAGNFLEALATAESNSHRVIIASTGKDRVTYAAREGFYFSTSFLEVLQNNGNVAQAFLAGQQTVQPLYQGRQTPWLDDNGDGVYDGHDLEIAYGRGLMALRTSRPALAWFRIDPNLGLLQAKLDNPQTSTQKVEVEIYQSKSLPPEAEEGYEAGQTQTKPAQIIELMDADKDQIYEAAFTFNQAWYNYTILASVWDVAGHQSPTYIAAVTPQTTTIPATGGTFTSPDNKVTVTFPPNAIQNTITLNYVEQPIEPPPHLAVLGVGFDLTAISERQIITGFNRPITITVTYDSPQQTDITADDIDLYWLDGTQWVTDTITSTVNPTSHQLTATTNHFTLFAVMSSKTQTQVYLPMILHR